MNNYFHNEVLAKNIIFDKEYKIIRQNDGQVRWLKGLGDLKFDSQGKAVRMIGTIHAVSYTHLDVYKRQIHAIGHLAPTFNQIGATVDKVQRIFLHRPPQVQGNILVNGFFEHVAQHHIRGLI